MANIKQTTLTGINRFISDNHGKTLKIRVADETTDKVDVILSKLQGRRQKNLLSSLDLIDCTETAEARLAEIGLPKAFRAGAEIVYGGGPGAWANSYGYAIETTVARMLRTTTGWFLVEVWSDDLYPKANRPDRIYLTPDQDNIAVANFRRQYRIKSA